MPHLDSTRDVVYWLADLWFRFKNGLEIDAGLNDGILHVAAGLILMLGLSLALRLPLRSLALWLIVLALQLANEASDLYWSALKNDSSLAASALDTAMTMLLPTVLLLVGRLRPHMIATLRGKIRPE